MTDLSIAHSLLKKFKQAGADDVVVNAVTSTKSQLKFVNSKIATTQSWNATQYEVFVAVKKCPIATTIRDVSEGSVNDSVARVMSFAKSAPANEDYRGIATGPFSYRDIPDTYDPKVVELGEKSVDLTQAALSAAAEHGAKRTAGVFEHEVVSSGIVTSNGVEAVDRGTRMYFSLRAFVDKYASGHHVINSRVLSQFDPVASAVKAATIAVDSQNPQPGTAGTYDILFEPLPYSNLLGEIGQMSSVFNVESQLSCLAGKLGQQVAASDVTISDNGSLPNGFNSRKFDVEGVPTQKNVIIENGILKTYLHNTSTAARYDTKTTANAGIISPSPFNVVFDNGKLNKEEIISKIQKGLIVTNVWYTRFQNYATGEFSTIPRDGIFLVENGEIKGAVKELRISDKLLNMVKNVVAAGKDGEQIFGWEAEIPVTTPPVLVKDVNVTKSVA